MTHSRLRAADLILFLAAGAVASAAIGMVAYLTGRPYGELPDVDLYYRASESDALDAFGPRSAP